MGVSENRGTSQWMAYNGKPENPIKMHDLGGKPTIFRKHPKNNIFHGYFLLLAVNRKDPIDLCLGRPWMLAYQQSALCEKGISGPVEQLMRTGKRWGDA